MRVYLSYFRLRLQMGLQYRMAGWAGLATQFFWGFLMVMVYEAFYRSSNAVQPIALEQLVSYVWLSQAFLAVIMMHIRDAELASLIVSGNVAYELVRPLNLYVFWFVRLLSQRLAAVALRCVPILAVAFILPYPFRLGLPASVGALVGFIATLIVGLLIVTSLSALSQILNFWTLSPSGTNLMFIVVADFLSGTILALPLMPAVLQKILYYLPFAYTADLPMRIYTGHMPLSALPGMLLRQSGWALALILFGAFLMRRAMRRVVVHGG